jgi:aminoglycoside phosphotransferase family enzyme
VCGQIRENIAQCLQLSEPLGTQAELRELCEPFVAGLRAIEPWIDARRRAGHVRECHGDLHSRNVVRYAGRLIAFDCIDFEPAFRWIDVAEEIAFC